MDRSILEEILLMVLEIINSCLTNNLHNNPHLIYSLLYQREVFEPYRTHPSLMDLIQNIETVSHLTTEQCFHIKLTFVHICR